MREGYGKGSSEVLGEIIEKKVERRVKDDSPGKVGECGAIVLSDEWHSLCCVIDTLICFHTT
jgi:hypothetical protein